MSFQQNGSDPAKMGDLLSRFQPQETVFEDEYVSDPLARRIRLVRREVLASTNAPARPRVWSYKCRHCRDRGVIDYVREEPFKARVIEYTFVARCWCPAAEKVSESIPTFAEIFGAWPA